MSIQFQKPDYIIVFVGDMQRSITFYHDVLGLPLKFSSPGWTEFNTGVTTIALHTTSGDGSAQKVSFPQPGNAQIGFMVDDIQSAYEALKAQGASFSLPPQKQNSGAILAVLNDPDGLGITLQQR
jgi:catechol 2,3-dioxygenase-like lactoylglutathione lyase family enzyme